MRAILWCLWAVGLSGLWASAQATPPVRDVPDLALWGTAFPVTSARHPDGRVLVGGDLKLVGSTPLRQLARFNADGSLDTGFRPQLPFDVDDIQLDSLGRAYLMLRPFSSAARGTAPQVVRVLDDASGTIDPSFQLELPAGVEDSGFALLVDEPADALYAAYRRAASNDYIVRRHVLTSGALDPGFELSVNNLVFDLARSGNDLLVAGWFTQVAGQPMLALAKVNAQTGALDLSWNPAAAGQPVGGQLVRGMLLDGDHVFIVGAFQGIGAPGSRGMARISLATGGADPQWLTPIVGSPGALGKDPSGRLLVGGAPVTIGGQPWLSGLTRFNADGSHDSGFGQAADVSDANTSRWLHVLPDGSVLRAIYNVGDSPSSLVRYEPLAGAREAWSSAAIRGTPSIRRLLSAPGQGHTLITPYALLAGETQVGAVQLGEDLQPQPGWRSDLGSVVNFISPQDGAYSSQHLYLAGFISEAPNRPAIRRLSRSSGAADLGWVPAVSPPNQPSSFRVVIDEAAGFAYVAGAGGISLNRFSLATGARDSSWTPSAVQGNQILQMQLHNGLLYLAGSFTSIGGQPIPRLARIPTGGAGVPDASWVPAPGGASSFHIDGNSGWIYVGGGDSNGNIVLQRYSLTDASLDPLWQPLRGRAGSVSRLSFDTERGELIALGQLAAGCDGRQLQAVRFVGEGRRVDPDWSVQLNVNGSLADVSVLASGDALVAGLFERINGAARQSLAQIGPGNTIFADGLGDAGGCVR